MGLDQYADGLNKEFYWRKHARLQVFMAREYEKQNPKETKASINSSDLGHLGFNGCSNPNYVNITDEILDRLEIAIKNGYYNYFAHDGFFWGQQYQEESVKEYKELDKQFLRAARKALKAGREVTYNCSW
jgi:NAD-specific glutamate dehydrogenase